MKSGFAHFDGSHRENFCAAVLLLAMEVDETVKGVIADVARSALNIETSAELVGFGREAWLETGADDESDARVDLWLLFHSPASTFYVFIEVKTHNRWPAEHVQAQVRDQAARNALVRATHPIRGSILLGPDTLCRAVSSLDSGVPVVTWSQLLRQLRTLTSGSPLTELAIRHLEETMERVAGIDDRTLSLSDFERATTTVACLRQFLLECIAEMKGAVRGEPFYLTPGDGQPRRGSGWAWHGLAVPFTIAGRNGRAGIYKYAEAPLGEQSAKDSLWLEAYFGDEDTPAAFVQFNPATLSSNELRSVRERFMVTWNRFRSSAST